METFLNISRISSFINSAKTINHFKSFRKAYFFIFVSCWIQSKKSLEKSLERNFLGVKKKFLEVFAQSRNSQTLWKDIKSNIDYANGLIAKAESYKTTSSNLAKSLSGFTKKVFPVPRDLYKTFLFVHSYKKLNWRHLFQCE